MNEDAGTGPGDYRGQLLAFYQKSQETYDKTVVTLSGGALGVSFAFVKDIVGPGSVQSTTLLLLSWIAWALSLTAALASFYTSASALMEQVEKVDKGTCGAFHPGGWSDRATGVLNLLAGVFFIGGVVLLAFFVHANLGVHRGQPTP